MNIDKPAKKISKLSKKVTLSENESKIILSKYGIPVVTVPAAKVMGSDSTTQGKRNQGSPADFFRIRRNRGTREKIGKRVG